MITERSTAARSLRAVALAITLVSVVSFSAIGYSTYVVASGVFGKLQTGSSAVSVTAVRNGTSAVLYVNATIPNNGLFPLRLSASCGPPQKGITCSPVSLTVPPSQSGSLRFRVSIANVTALQSGTSALRVNGTVTAELVPWASITVVVDLGQFLKGGG